MRRFRRSRLGSRSAPHGARWRGREGQPRLEALEPRWFLSASPASLDDSALAAGSLAPEAPRAQAGASAPTGAVTSAGASTSTGTLAGPPSPSGFQPSAELFQRFDGKSIWTNFFGPIALRLDSGVLIVVAEARTAASDRSTFDFVARRSLDNGQTWSPLFVVHHDVNNINLGSLVQDKQTGRLFLLYAINSSDIGLIASSDEGLNWSKPTNITADVKLTTGVESWGLYAPGPAPGIQLEHGPFAGRLIVTANHRHGFDRLMPSFTNTIYSDDHGQTWHRGGGMAETVANYMTNEAAIVERNNGELYMSMRVARSGDLRRAYAVSSDGGATWTDAARDGVLTVPTVQGSLLRVNDNLILFGAPSNTVDSTRREYTIWSSTDDAHTWTRRKTIFFDVASYSSLALAGPDQILVTYNRSHQLDSGGDLMQIGYSIVSLDWLNSSDPYQFTYYFDEKEPGSEAVVGSSTIFDFGPWDNRLTPQSSDRPPMYVAGRNGDAALSLSLESDNVLLANSTSAAMRFSGNASFTIEALVRLTSSTGALIGPDAGFASFALEFIEGKLAFTLGNGDTSVTAQGATSIQDGAWHRIAASRDAATKTLRVYVDGQLDASANYSFDGVLQSDTNYTIGSRGDLSQQLGIDIDTLRVTRTLLEPGQFLPIDAVGPGYRQPAAPPAGAPSSLPGLQLWVGAGDYAPFFSRSDFATPMSAANRQGDVSQSGFDLSPNQRQVWARNPAHLDFDSLAGYYWNLGGTFTEPPGWYVRNDDLGPGPFDFVQNTGQFTLAATFKLDQLNQDTVLFDNINLTTQTPGFALVISRSGTPTIYISDAKSPARLVDSFASSKVSANIWYQIVVVGEGPGKPVTLYLTPLAESTVRSVSGISPIVGANGDYPASKARTLMMGSRAAAVGNAITGGMTDMLIYDRPLTPAEVQELHDFATRPMPILPHQPAVNSVFTNVNTQTTEPIIVTRSPLDGDAVTHFRISGMYGGTVQLADGVTPVANGQFISVQQGLAGLRFTPGPGFLGEAMFTIQASVGASVSGLGFTSAVAIVQVGPPNLPPTFDVSGPKWVNEDGTRETIAGFVTHISPGGPEETNQAVAFQVTTDNPALFAEQPAISADGTLTFQPAPNANGVANLFIIARDNGGTAAGGSDTSQLALSRIIVIPVNDPPQFTPGPDVVVDASASDQTLQNWATNIGAGPPDEASQLVTFQIGNDRPDLFAVQPRVAADGTLTFRPAAGARGVAHLSLVAQDNGGTVNGGRDASAPVLVAIGIGPALTVSGTAGDDAFRILRVGADFAIYRNADPAPIEQWPVASWIGLNFAGLDGKDSLSVDLSGGNPLPPLVRFEGGSGADLLRLTGTSSETVRVVSHTQGLVGGGEIELGSTRIQVAGLESLDVARLSEVRYASPLTGNQFVINSGTSSSQIVASGATLPMTFSSLGTLRVVSPDVGAQQTVDEIILAGSGALAASKVLVDTGLTGDYIGVDLPFVNLAWPNESSPLVTLYRGVTALESSQQMTSLVLAGGALNVSGVGLTVQTEGLQVDASSRVTVGLGNTLHIGGAGLSISDLQRLVKSGAGRLDIGAVGNVGPGAWLDVSAGTARLLADGGSHLSVSTAANLEFDTSQDLAALVVADGGVARLATGGRRVLSVQSLSIAPRGSVDITDNGLRVATAGKPELAAAMLGYLRAGRKLGWWDGLGGVTSSLAAQDAELLTGLGGGLNNYGLGDMLNLYLFDVAVVPTDFVLRYTYSGDINLDGIVDALDYELIDLSYSNTDYFAGDLNLDGHIDGDDYAILDNSFNFQGQPLGVRADLGVAPLSGGAPRPLVDTPAAAAPLVKDSAGPSGLAAFSPVFADRNATDPQPASTATSWAGDALPAVTAAPAPRSASAPALASGGNTAHATMPAPRDNGLLDAPLNWADLLDAQLVELLAQSRTGRRERTAT